MSDLFPDFLNNAEQYKNSQIFWREICERVLAENNQSNQWVSRFDETEKQEGNDTVLHEGNPIYWLVNPTQSKGVRIIQQDPKIHTKWIWAAWTDNSGDEYSEFGLIKEFVYTCNLNLETADIFEKLFEKWIQPETDVQNMEEMIKGLLYKSS